MRKQYHFRPSPNGFFAWDVDRLVALSSELPAERVALKQISELDEPYWFSRGEPATCRAMAQHFKLMLEADLQYPILICADGKVMDGMHRVTKALALGHEDVLCVRFRQTPEPDFRDVQPDDLSY